MNKKRIVAYLRVSTAEQAEEGYSIDAQENAIRQKCEQEGGELVAIYADKGISGKSMNNRLQLQQMLKDAKSNKFDEVWVWKTNRMARNQYDLLTIVKRLEKYDVAFRSCSEAFETSTPAGKLMMNVLASIGEFERETIVDNVKMGMKQRAKTGKWNGGIILGYRTVTVNEKDTRLEIVQEEATTVKKIFELYSSGKGLKAITNQINHEGYKTKKGNMFTTGGVKDILMNPTYIGKIRYNVRENWGEKRRKGINKNPIIVDGEHEAIIPVDLWEKVQEMYKLKSGKPKKAFESDYILTGLMKCPVCGASMVASRTRKKRKDGTYLVTRYYVCGNWRSKGTAACHSNGVRADYAEEYVVSRIKEVVFNENILKDIVKNLNKDRKDTIKPLERELEQLTKSLKELENRKNRVFELYEDGTIDKQTLAQRIENMTKEIDVKSKRRIKIQKELESNNSVNIPYEVVKDTLSNFHKLLEVSATEDKKTLLQLIISKITIKNKKDIASIELHFDEKTQKYFINNEEGESPDDGGSPSFILFTIKI
ncbi:recombinase family protein [Clostridium intestinale]|uniref:recombinase family protein n=1 Tax=Clostridium intestinale TaxID=36845 RepID=UPI002DD67993|nr:recombinase family protein [Clostridium intestinale]WRY50600.1 recombinase family protein [Clostridium intestinale]